jgi:hypothetical protein
MRVLHLDSGREMRGGQWQVLRLIEALAASGVESTLLAHDHSPLTQAAQSAGLRVEALSLRRAWALQRSHDLIHVHDAHTHSIALLLRQRPVVVSRRVAFPIRSRWKYRHAARFIAVSECVRAALTAGGVPAGSIDVVYDGVPLLEPSSGSEILAMDKGTGILGPLGLKPAGKLEDDIRSARLFVYASNSEGLGSGALLAMSAGVPVVASDIGGLREIVRSGTNGILVPNQTEAFAAAVARLRDDPAELRRMGMEARRTVEERFTIARMAEGTLAAYARALAGESAARTY